MPLIWEQSIPECKTLHILMSDILEKSSSFQSKSASSALIFSLALVSILYLRTTYIHNYNQRSITSSSDSLWEQFRLTLLIIILLISFWELDSQSHMISCCHKMVACRILWVEYWTLCSAAPPKRGVHQLQPNCVHMSLWHWAVCLFVLVVSQIQWIKIDCTLEFKGTKELHVLQ